MLVHYFYLATLAVTVGIGARTFVPLSMLLLLLLIGAVFCLGLLWRYYLRAGVGIAIVVCSVALVLGVLRMEAAWSKVGTSPLADQVGQSVELVGTVVREPELRERTVHLYIKTDEGTVLVFADRYEEVKYGDVVEVRGKLKKPDAFTTDLGRTFNYPGHLLARGVEYTVSFPVLTVVGSGEGNWLLTYLFDFKGRFTDALAIVLPEPQFGLGVGLLLGVKQGLGAELEEVFRTTGIIHIVVLSGYNVMLVVSFVTYVMAFGLAPRPRLVVGLCAIALFALLVGLSATVLRASIMAGLFLIAETFGRQYVVLRGLLLAGVVMLLINPYLLVYDVGFQLSFIATLGLILVAPRFETELLSHPYTIKLKEFFIATVATQIAVLPLLLYQIGQLSLIAVVVNVLVLPAVPVAMLLTFVTGLVSMWSLYLGSFLMFPTYLSLEYVIATAQLFASIPLAAVTVPAFSFWYVPIAYALMGYLLYRYHTRSQSVIVTSLAGWEVADEVSVRTQLRSGEGSEGAKKSAL